MDLQIVDVEACQVKSADAGQKDWIAALRNNASKLDLEDNYESLPMWKADKEACFLVRLWCRAASGESVCLTVCNAMRNTYWRLRVPGPSQHRIVQALMEVLEQECPGLARCEVVHRCTTAGWISDPKDVHKPWRLPWLKISVASTWQLDRITSKGKGASKGRGRTDVPWLDQVAQRLNQRMPQIMDTQTAHRALDVRTEVLEAIGVKAGGWLRLPSELLARLQHGVRGLSCHAVLQAKTTDLVGCALDTMAMAPLRVLSFDIECISAEDGFPQASLDSDAVICIGLYCKVLGAPVETASCEMLYLGDADAFEADGPMELRCFSTEVELLCAFGETIRRMDADVVAGYNTCLFDWRYLQERIERIVPQGRRGSAQAFSRYTRLPTPPKEQDLASSALGDNPLCYPKVPGRVNFDLWLHLKRENISGLENLKLNTVSKHFLNEEKHDLEAKAMFRAHREGPAGRGKVASYCRQDCKLVLDLMEKLEALPSVWEMAKITCTAPEDILFRGQQLKVYTQLVMKANECGYLVEDRVDAGEEGEGDDGYQGATVVDPTPGYYLDPVFCLDFASLYPSLMRTKNLSPDCLVRGNGLLAPEVNEIKVRDGVVHRFVKGSVHEGLLPRILEQLLSERKRVKRLMEAEADPRIRALLNSKQLALKISANSVYGACGATKGRLSCRECAEATTAAGRDAIDFTCKYVRDKPGFQIVYGDTDSAFMRIPEEHRGDSVEELFQMGEKLAAEVTAAIAALMPGERNYIKLEFEKILHPLVLYKKKRYAGLCVEDPKKQPKVMAKGLELVRKDACQLVKAAQRRVIDLLLKERDVHGARQAMMAALQSVLQVPRGGPFAAIKQSKSLRSTYKDEYSQVHCVVRDLMKARENGSEPRVGDRVEFVVVASSSSRVVDKAEDVAHAERQTLPPDWLHYFEAVERSLMAILEVPLGTISPTSLEEVRLECAQLRAKAQHLVSQHCMARHGTSWSSGHVCKDGTVQQKLRDVVPTAEAAERPFFAPAAKKQRKAEAEKALARQLPLTSFLAKAPGA
jgi:DNA polymerase delta subunit 1